MNSVGIDVSKNKSTVAIMRPFGEIVTSPYEVNHNTEDFKKLASDILKLPGETKVIMEYTGKYHKSIADFLQSKGIFVSLLHPKLVHDYGNRSIRKSKTDKKDAIKIANYGIDSWLTLKKYVPEDNIRQSLKNFNRQYHQYMKIKTSLKTNLISLLDVSFPNINRLFTSSVRNDGHQKWIDFANEFWHYKCVSNLTKTNFREKYKDWCKNYGYNFSISKSDEIYLLACHQTTSLPKNESTKKLIQVAISQLNFISKSLSDISKYMQNLSSLLPEYNIVMNMVGVGDILGPQLIAEIGDVRRFYNKKCLVAFAGIDAPPFQSGAFESKNRKISKRGSPILRKILYQVMSCILKRSPEDNLVYKFLDKKRSEGKHYYVYMMAGANKFLRIYYARFTQYFKSLDSAS